ncbi:MAG: KTSC domain-containing protein [Bryobacterales bacterium]|nr:KTSC domain-containing protein [Bryobacterales bacterium]
MKSTAVESNSLATVAYDAERQALQIEFRDNTVYRYFGVPADVYQCLLLAPSKGSYFNRAIRNRYAHVRVASLS